MLRTKYKVRFQMGTQAEYDNLAQKDSHIIYCITDTPAIYIGDTKYTNNTLFVHITLHEDIYESDYSVEDIYKYYQKGYIIFALFSDDLFALSSISTRGCLFINVSNDIHSEDISELATFRASTGTKFTYNRTKLATSSELTTLETKLTDMISVANQQINSLTESTKVTLSETTESTGNALKSYVVKQGDTTVGTIDIPKDLVVISGEIVEATAENSITINDTVYTSGEFLKLTIANQTNPVYIDVAKLVDTAVATTTSNGLMSKEDKLILDSLKSSEFIVVHFSKGTNENEWISDYTCKEICDIVKNGQPVIAFANIDDINWNTYFTLQSGIQFSTGLMDINFSRAEAVEYPDNYYYISYFSYYGGDYDNKIFKFHRHQLSYPGVLIVHLKQGDYSQDNHLQSYIADKTAKEIYDAYTHNIMPYLEWEGREIYPLIATSNYYMDATTPDRDYYYLLFGRVVCVYEEVSYDILKMRGSGSTTEVIAPEAPGANLRYKIQTTLPLRLIANPDMSSGGLGDLSRRFTLLGGTQDEVREVMYKGVEVTVELSASETQINTAADYIMLHPATNNENYGNVDFVGIAHSINNTNYIVWLFRDTAVTSKEQYYLRSYAIPDSLNHIIVTGKDNTDSATKDNFPIVLDKTVKEIYDAFISGKTILTTMNNGITTNALISARLDNGVYNVTFDTSIGNSINISGGPTETKATVSVNALDWIDISK